MGEPLRGVTLPLTSVLSALSVMALREIPSGLSPRVRVYTREEALDRRNDRWILEYERDGVRIRDILAGRVRVTGLSTSSHLHMMIELIYTFFDKERENWTWFKHRYARMERNMAMNLYNVICAVKLNIDLREGAKPPIDRHSFYKLMLCWEFEPFYQHLSDSKQRRARRHLGVIQFYYDTLNTDGQAEMLHQIEREDQLRVGFHESDLL